MRKRIVKASKLFYVVAYLLIWGFLTLGIAGQATEDELRLIKIEMGIEILMAALIIVVYYISGIGRILDNLYEDADDPTIHQLEEKLEQISQQLEALHAQIAGNGPGMPNPTPEQKPN